ncbi:MAG: bifunctional (p)ppGpp synthetase/guanosine-3',5'-bis(diphosphate) 3'-pyrophosphohydrolase [Oscillospiraceae bacterium]|jgi:GTP pyrophosphokinase|nr:bifunctional (p)ppGpp synthetase/guanosine-3',5'-bis(diphosphate) 3'-pyrophosphohydrolase [Oscillospiraceae bacterium]
MERKISQLLELGFTEGDTTDALYINLERVILADYPDFNVERLRAAYFFARKYHGSQKRNDGSPFVTHPVATALIYAERMRVDEAALMACLLHDTIEDCEEVNYGDIETIFGKEVADMVEGVTKLTRVNYSSKDEEATENIRKTLLATAKDVRVMLIKLADRTHNLRTLDYKSSAKQREKAAETIEIYAPIAHRLGMQSVKWELEDRSIPYLDPEACEEINDFLEKNQAGLVEFMKSVKEALEQRLKEEHIEAEVQSRLKHLYSIYRKMYSQNKGLKEVHDLCAFRIITNDIGECYHVLGIAAELYHPAPGKLKDYIAGPKPNGYKSIHNTYIGRSGVLFEVQIRTREMHNLAEYGVAAHWKYKSGGQQAIKQDDEKTYAWIRDMLSLSDDLDPDVFQRELKANMFADEVMVFTPKGDSRTLPSGATPIDFAYKLHSDIGNHMSGAKINGRIVPFDYKLQSGDVVEIETSRASSGPSLDWLEKARSPEARGKIRQWFKRERRTETVALGKSAFEAELKRSHLILNEIIKSGALAEVIKKMNFATPDDLFASIGIRSRSSIQAVNRVRDELIKRNQLYPEHEYELRERVTSSDMHHKHEAEHHIDASEVLVDGESNIAVKFAQCCSPVPGDKIVGFNTRGYGTSIHRSDCPNYLNDKARNNKRDQWVPAEWGDGTQSRAYLAGIKIVAADRGELIIDIASAISSAKLGTKAFNASTNANAVATIYISLTVTDTTDVSTAITKIRHINGITSVERCGTE